VVSSEHIVHQVVYKLVANSLEDKPRVG
jgi:hypothetical protein